LGEQSVDETAGHIEAFRSAPLKAGLMMAHSVKALSRWNLQASPAAKILSRGGA
jgi:hypothetical protein